MCVYRAGQSCNRLGQYSCLRCKTCFCEEHVRRRGVRAPGRGPPPCPRCAYPTHVTSDLAMSTRSHRYGRQPVANYDDEDDQDDHAGAYSAGLHPTILRLRHALSFFI